MQDWKIGDPNKSQVFVIPFLGKVCNEFGSFGKNAKMPTSQFRNCFIGDKTKGIEDRILLLYRFNADPLYLNFEAKLEDSHPLFEKRYEVDKKHTMFVFGVPEEAKEDYNKILKGDYSKITEKSKAHILAFHGLKPDSNTGGVLYKTSAKKQSLEDTINKGLPSSQWTKIPDDVELEESFNERIEYFQEEYRIKPAISPSEEFNT